MALPALLSDRHAIIVEITIIHNPSTGDQSILRLSNTPGVKRARTGTSITAPGYWNLPQDSADYAFYDDRLVGPVQITSRISIDQVGSVQKGVEAIGGSIDFAIGRPGIMTSDDYITQWLNLPWKGSQVWVWQGPTGSTDFNQYTTVFIGMVDDLSHTISVATIKLGGSLREIDGAINTSLYGTVPGTPSSVVDKAKPQVYGYARYVEPILMDDGSQTYDITWGTPLGVGFTLGLVANVKVGGIVWNEWGGPITSTTPTGYYHVDYAAQRIQLSGVPGSLDLRLDAYLNGYLAVTAGFLIRSWLIARNIPYNPASFDQLNIDCPQNIGFATGLEPVNLLDAIDQVLAGVGAFMSENAEGEISVYAIKPPNTVSDDPTYDLEGQNADGIVDFRLIRLLPRAWQVRTEYDHVWSPASNFAESADETTVSIMKGPGITLISYGPDIALHNADPSSIEPPIIKTLVNDPGFANQIGNRLGACWGAERRVYEVTLKTEPPKINTTIHINYRSVYRYMRVISVVKNLGIGTAVIQIWG